MIETTKEAKISICLSADKIPSIMKVIMRYRTIQIVNMITYPLLVDTYRSDIEFATRKVALGKHIQLSHNKMRYLKILGHILHQRLSIQDAR
jgi:hypothetical protein